MKNIIKYMFVVPVVSFLLCSCKLNASNDSDCECGSLIGNYDSSIDSESNWEEMITNCGLFINDISFEIENISEDGDRTVLQKEDNRFKGQYFHDDEVNDPYYISFDKNSRQEGNVFTWTIYGEHGEVLDYPMDGFVAEFIYPFFFKKSDLTYDNISHSYKADSLEYTLVAEDYTFEYQNVEMKFENGVLTYVEFYRKDVQSAPMGEEPPVTYIKEQIYFRNYNQVHVTIPY